MPQKEFDPDVYENLSDAERAERDQLRARISQYFCERIERDPAVLEVAPIASLWGKIQDGSRTETLCNSSDKPQFERLEFPHHVLEAQLCLLGHYHPGGSQTALFAIYPNEPLLWLDDHISNNDFDVFWKHEQLHWEDAHEAAGFMMKTKFHYVPEPSRYFLLNSVGDIPQKRLRDSLIEHHYDEELQKYDKELADVAPLIYAPSLTTNDSGIDLRFCVYIHAGGRVWSLNCHFDLNGNLSHAGEILGDWVGEAFAPR